MRKTAMVGTVSEFEQHMSDIQKMDDKAHTWLKILNPAWWTKSHFNAKCKCDAFINNMNKSFNSYITEVRYKPVVCMNE